MQVKYGFVSQVDYDKGKAKVDLDGDGIVTDWLPVILPKTKGDQYYIMPDVGEHVCCLLDKHIERGVILGAFYSTRDMPGDLKGEDITGVMFSDGTFVKYERTVKKLTVSIGTAEFIIDSSGYQIKNGAETLKSILSDLIDQIVLETHPTAMGPSGPPINAAAYTAIKTRLLTLLT